MEESRHIWNHSNLLIIFHSAVGLVTHSLSAVVLLFILLTKGRQMFWLEARREKNKCPYVPGISHITKFLSPRAPIYDTFNKHWTSWEVWNNFSSKWSELIVPTLEFHLWWILAVVIFTFLGRFCIIKIPPTEDVSNITSLSSPRKMIF